MGGRFRTLLSVPFYLFSPLKRCQHQTPNARAFLGFKLLYTATTGGGSGGVEKERLQKSNRDSIVLEKFRLRQHKGSLKTPQTKSPPSPLIPEKESKSIGDGLEAFLKFEELGLNEMVVGALGDMGIFVPSEIQCVGIPALLQGKSVVMSSHSGSGRTLAYLLPLLQLLRQDAVAFGMKPKHPRAVVLCTTEELSEQVFQTAKIFRHYTQLKYMTESGRGQLSIQEDTSNASIGMLIGTPGEVLQQIEEGDVVIDAIKYLVLDEAHTIFDNGFGPEVHTFLGKLKNRASNADEHALQTILVISTITEPPFSEYLNKHCPKLQMLNDNLVPLVERLEHDNAGKVAAMLLEMDPNEVFNITGSPDALKKKVVEAVDSLYSTAS